MAGVQGTRTMRKMLVALAICAGLGVSLATCTWHNGDTGSEAGAEAVEVSDTTPEVDREAVAAASSEPGALAKEEREATVDKSEEELQAEQEALRSEAESDGRETIAGTLTMMSGTELCEFEGVSLEATGAPDEVADSLYAVLVLDERTKEHVVIGRSVPAHEEWGDTASDWWESEGGLICVVGSFEDEDGSFPYARRCYDVDLVFVG